jgi:hypothetical protein
LACALLLALTATPCAAQRVAAPAARPSRIQPTFRADVIVADRWSVQGAAGVQIATAYNVRVAADAGVGAVSRATGWHAAGRMDVLLRWLSDPFRESRWALNAGGGLGLNLEDSRRVRPVAIVTVGLDAPAGARWLRGVEVGLGGGVRAGVTLRRSSARRR